MSLKSKAFATIAVVGTVAAVAAVFCLSGQSASGEVSSVPGGRFLQAGFSMEDMKEFNKFVQNFNKNYLTNSEFNARFDVFQQNLNAIKKHNKNNKSFKLKLNKFADLSPAEFAKLQGLRPGLGRREDRNTRRKNRQQQ